MSRTFRALRTVAVSSGFNYLSQALGLLVIPVLLGTLGTESYGLLVTVMAFMGYLGFADAGMSWGAMIVIAQAHGRGDRDEIAHIIRHSAVLATASALLVMVVLGGILFAAAHGWRLPMFTGYPQADWLLAIAALQLVFTFQASIFTNIFHGLQEGHWPGFYQGVGRFVGLLISMIVAWQTRNVAAVLAAQVACSILSGTVLVVHAWRRHRWAFRRGSWRDSGQYALQVRVGGKNFLLQIGRVLGATAPAMVLSSVLGPAAVPFYTVPFTLLSLFFVPLTSWSAIMQTAYGEAWVAGAHTWVRDTLRRSYEYLFLFGGLGMALFLALSDSFVRFWTHERLTVEPLNAVAVAAIVGLGAWLMNGQFLLTGLNRHRQVAFAEIANGVLSLGLAIVAVRKVGFIGIGLGVVGAGLATSVWVVRRELRRQLGETCFPNGWFSLRIVLGTLAAASVARGVIAWQGSHEVPLTLVALAALAGVGAFSAIAFGTRLVAWDDIRDQLRRLRPGYRTS